LFEDFAATAATSEDFTAMNEDGQVIVLEVEDGGGKCLCVSVAYDENNTPDFSW